MIARFLRLLAIFILIKCASSDLSRTNILDRSKDDDSIKSQSQSSPFTENESSILFVESQVIPFELGIDVCFDITESKAREQIVKYLNDVLISEKYIQRNNKNSPVEIEHKLMLTSFGALSSVKVIERYWEKQQVFDKRDDYSLKLFCLVKVAIDKSYVQEYRKFLDRDNLNMFLKDQAMPKFFNRK